MRRISLLVACLLASPTARIYAQPPTVGYAMSKDENLSWPILKRGQRESRVRVLQQLMNIRGFATQADGYFGASTEKAVKSFQAARKIQVDGVVGWQTWEKLVVPLQRGSRGSAVRVLQELLSRNGYRVKPDGVFGEATQKVVRKYQEKEAEGMMSADGRAPKWVWCWLLGGTNITD